jgi:hypothetical protein
MPLANLIRDTVRAVVEARRLERREVHVEVWRVYGSAGH